MSFMCHNKRRSPWIDLSEDDKRKVLAMLEKTMSERERIDAAEKAAADWSPDMMNQDPGLRELAT